MSSEAKGKISINDQPFRDASKRVEADFRKMAVAGQQSGQKIKQASTSSGNAINSFKSTIPPARDALQNLSQQANQTGQSLGNMGQQAQQTSRDTTALAVSVLGLGQSIGGLSDGIFGFQEKLVALEKSQFGLKETTEDLKRAEEDFAEALSKGFDSARERERAETDLLLLRQKLRIETKEVKAEQEALNSEFVNFGLTVTQTGIFGLIAMQQILPATVKEQIKLKLSTISLSGAMKSMGFNFAAAAVQFKAVNFSLKGVAAGIKGVWLALGPIGIAIIGVTVAMEAWNSNIFGVQEKLQDLWDMLKNFIPVLQGLEILVQSIFPEANAELSDFDNNLNNVNESLRESTESLTGYDLVLGQTVENQDKLNQSLTSTMASDIPEWYRQATNSVKNYTKELTEAEKIQNKIFEDAGKVIQESKKKADVDESGFVPSEGHKTLADALRNNPDFQPGINSSTDPSSTPSSITNPAEGASQLAGLFAGQGAARDRAGGHSKFRRDRIRGKVNTILRDVTNQFGDLLAATGVSLPRYTGPGRLGNNDPNFREKHIRAFEQWRRQVTERIELAKSISRQSQTLNDFVFADAGTSDISSIQSSVDFLHSNNVEVDQDVMNRLSYERRLAMYGVT